MSEQQRTNSTMRFAGLATQWMVLMLIAVWGGIKVDDLVGLRFPLFVILFALLALAISFWQLLKELNNKKK